MLLTFYSNITVYYRKFHIEHRLSRTDFTILDTLYLVYLLQLGIDLISQNNYLDIEKTHYFFKDNKYHKYFLFKISDPHLNLTGEIITDKKSYELYISTNLADDMTPFEGSIIIEINL